MIDLDSLVTVDFETFPIKARPDYPPKTVGVSIKRGRTSSDYYAWGHVSGGNNCTQEEGVAALRKVWDSGRPLLFHNAKFDTQVACEGLGLKEPPWSRVHDTTFLVFLADPHCKHAGLKEICADWLDWPPDERDAIGEWAWEHRKKLYELTGERPTRQDGKVTKVWKWIAYAPGDVVAPYAEGDTDRTAALFEMLYPLIVENGMEKAYDRERRLMPILSENERVGMRVDLAALERDVAAYQADREKADAWLRKRLQQPDLNIDSDDEFAEALYEAGVVDDDKWTYTKTGKRSVAKGALTPEMYNDPEVATAFGYHNRLGTSLKMFMEPWLTQGAARGGYISTNWNQIRGGEGGGTRTGRPSTSAPNFLNISKKFEGRTDRYAHPSHLDVFHLPEVRNYCLPDEGHLWLHRDWDGQELRVYADLERGDLYRKYEENPRFKPHAYINGVIENLTGEKFDPTTTKNVNFGKIYGAGIPRIMELLGTPRVQAIEFNAVHDQAMPDLRVVKEVIKGMALSGEPIRTWGGRVYYPEDPKIIDGRSRDFIYKLTNYYVQGSAADACKEAIIRWYTHPDRDPTDRFLLAIYDESNISAAKERWTKAMRVLKESMEGLEFSVPMLSSPKVGTSWGTCEKVEE